MAQKKVSSKGKVYEYVSLHVCCADIDSKRLTELSEYLEVNKSYIIRKAIKLLHEREFVK
mgnify:CR=1 FL=1